MTDIQLASPLTHLDGPNARPLMALASELVSKPTAAADENAPQIQ